MKVCALPKGAFLHVSTAGAFGSQVLSSFFGFWPVWGVPVGALLGQIVVKNGVSKMFAKMVPFLVAL